jgi:hypothetical protein
MYRLAMLGLPPPFLPELGSRGEIDVLRMESLSALFWRQALALVKDQEVLSAANLHID